MGPLVIAGGPLPVSVFVDTLEQYLRGDLGGEDGDAETVLYHPGRQIMPRDQVHDQRVAHQVLVDGTTHRGVELMNALVEGGQILLYLRVAQGLGREGCVPDDAVDLTCLAGDFIGAGYDLPGHLASPAVAFSGRIRGLGRMSRIRSTCGPAALVDDEDVDVRGARPRRGIALLEPVEVAFGQA